MIHHWSHVHVVDYRLYTKCLNLSDGFSADLRWIPVHTRKTRSESGAGFLVDSGQGQSIDSTGISYSLKKSCPNFCFPLFPYIAPDETAARVKEKTLKKSYTARLSQDSVYGILHEIHAGNARKYTTPEAQIPTFYGRNNSLL